MERIALCILLALVAGCASAPARKTAAESAVRRLKVVDHQLDSQSAEIRRLQQTIARLEKKLASPPTPKAPTPGVVPMTKLTPEAEIPEDDEADEAGAEVDVDKMLSLDESEMKETNVIATSRADTSTSYFRGLHWFAQKNFDAAIRDFSQFLRENPEHVYADRAQAWLVECHFENHDYALTVFAANQLLAKFPFSMQLPEALHKRALSQIEQGDQEQASITLRDLLKRFPDAKIADSASRLLASIAAPRPGGRVTGGWEKNL